MPGRYEERPKRAALFRKRVLCFYIRFLQVPYSSSTKSSRKMVQLNRRAGGSGENIFFPVGIHAQEHEGIRTISPDPWRKKEGRLYCPVRRLLWEGQSF